MQLLPLLPIFVVATVLVLVVSVRVSRGLVGGLLQVLLDDRLGLFEV